MKNTLHTKLLLFVGCQTSISCLCVLISSLFFLQQIKSREGSKRRRKSYVDVKFIDKDDGDEEEEKKEDKNTKISPDALVDILA